MSAEKNEQFGYLDAAGKGLAAIARNPKTTVYLVTSALAAAGWLVVVSMGVYAAKTNIGEAAGPGAELLRMLPALQVPDALEFLYSRCLSPVRLADNGLATFLALWVMWFLMSLAMMLPSATPMLKTYCEVADTAAGRQMKAVHPLVIAGGYVTIWAIASAGFAALSLALPALPGTGSAVEPIGNSAASGALALAGLYQFSTLKDACLEKCRNPFSLLFGRWSENPFAIFRFGMEQGLYCLGCCWALMLVMFVVGLMNVFWMVLLAVLALFEKTIAGIAFRRVCGVILLVWAAALMFIPL